MPERHDLTPEQKIKARDYNRILIDASKRAGEDGPKRNSTYLASCLMARNSKTPADYGFHVLSTDALDWRTCSDIIDELRTLDERRQAAMEDKLDDLFHGTPDPETHDMAKEVPPEKFRELVNDRAGKAIKYIRLIGNLGSSQYEKTPEQIDKIEERLLSEVKTAVANLRANHGGSVGDII